MIIPISARTWVLVLSTNLTYQDVQVKAFFITRGTYKGRNGFYGFDTSAEALWAVIDKITAERFFRRNCKGTFWIRTKRVLLSHGKRHYKCEWSAIQVYDFAHSSLPIFFELQFSWSQRFQTNVRLRWNKRSPWDFEVYWFESNDL